MLNYIAGQRRIINVFYCTQFRLAGGPYGRSRAIFTTRRATAAVEFAIVAPAMLALLMGMLCFGLYFLYLHELQELAAAAARASLAGLNQAERMLLATQYVNNAVAHSALLNQTDLVVTTSVSGVPATEYEVTLTYSLRDTPIPLLAQFLSLHLGDISRTATIEFGGY